MALLEIFIPKRQLIQSKSKRWGTNLSISVINSFVVKLLGPVSAMVVAHYATNNNWGLFALTPLPLWLEIVLAFILLDLAIYFQHVLSHKIPLIWQFHKVHHSDRDIDVTTAIRFHPIEIVLSMLYKVVIIVILGTSPIAVFWFEVALNACAMFNHSNINLPLTFDKYIRKLLVTPDMHRVHHSIIVNETDSNYGFCLSIWDRWFKTYNTQPQQGHYDMIIGLENQQHHSTSNFFWSLAFPFKKRTDPKFNSTQVMH